MGLWSMLIDVDSVIVMVDDQYWSIPMLLIHDLMVYIRI